MAEPVQTNQRADIRDYLAAERTLLAWIRTGLALMGFGFLVARFGLFLQELRVAQRVPALPSYGLSLWFGVALIAMGVGVNLLSAWRHSRLIQELNVGEQARSRPSAQAVAIAVILALIGLAMAAYLVSIRRSTTSDFRQPKGETYAASSGQRHQETAQQALRRRNRGTLEGNPASQGRDPVRLG